MKLYQIILKPVTTEKSAVIAGENKYTFFVDLKANKIEIKKAIKKIYGVEAIDINIIHTPEKSSQRRLKRKSHKKAIITLKEGDTIDPIKFK